MLKRTFCHIPGIGPRLESRMWSNGFRSWDSVLRGSASQLPPRLRAHVLPHIHRSVAELEEGNAAFFAGRLPSSEQWRIFPEFRHAVAYFDIETTGLAPEYDAITTIVLYDGRSLRHYISGHNLGDFAADVLQYKLLVTYNGKCFDVPFVERYFRIEIDAAHIDLRYVLRNLGYRGGLKGCERQLGIDRGDLDGVDGYFAVLLWYDFAENGNDRALETLLAYNCEDVVNLERLMVMAYNMKIRATPFAAECTIPMPRPPRIPFKPDRRTIERLRRLAFSP